MPATTRTRLRSEFLVEGLFATRPQLNFVYTHVDRMILGGACPALKPLSFGAGADVGTEFFYRRARWASPISAAPAA